ncbi:hypothetical protein G5V59_26900 [Nocardioides sp. W3-2-3]|uniref:hypothetical protein n=1 Tax=Nocardioides convexus TaxID=2712224 RepID=UPI0024183A96|nr:hypothetical protein [Nocardioides convexus]NHA02022.1 hypothetical protein [Nocardioides convexus]
MPWRGPEVPGEFPTLGYLAASLDRGHAPVHRRTQGGRAGPAVRRAGPAPAPPVPPPARRGGGRRERRLRALGLDDHPRPEVGQGPAHRDDRPLPRLRSL